MLDFLPATCIQQKFFADRDLTHSTERLPSECPARKLKARMKLLAIANQKGGVGKTTTAVNLSTCLAQIGKRMLLIDLDPQGNATSALGLEDTSGHSLYEALIGQAHVEQKIVPTRFDRLSIIPADLDLAGAELKVPSLSAHLPRH